MNFLNLKQMDALEFVQSLGGGWDCIIWDPPYFNKSMDDFRNSFENSHLRHVNMDRLRIDESYLLLVKNNIIEKLHSFVWIEFYYKPLECDKLVAWLRMKNRGTIRGDKIVSNLEYINITLHNIKPLYQPLMYQCAYYGDNHGGAIKNTIKQVAFMKPIKLFQDLFHWLNVTHVLDPFAGSYNSAKACKKLGIKIDSCDKYLKPPDIIGLEKFL